MLQATITCNDMLGVYITRRHIQSNELVFERLIAPLNFPAAVPLAKGQSYNNLTYKQEDSSDKKSYKTNDLSSNKVDVATFTSQQNDKAGFCARKED